MLKDVRKKIVLIKTKYVQSQENFWYAYQETLRIIYSSTEHMLLKP